MTWSRLLHPLALCAAAAALAAAAPPDQPSLRPAEPASRELAAGESHVWQAELAAGQPWRIAVEQRGIDVTLEIRAPDGGRLLVDSPVDRDGTESLLWRPRAGGLHRVEVRSREPGAPPGRYEIRLDAVDPARAEAEEAVSRAGGLYAEGTPEARKKAILEQRRALDLWRALRDPREEARAVYALAVLSRLADDTRGALDLARQALPLWQALGDRVREAATWNETGLDLWLLGEAAEARAAFERALALQQEAGDRYGEAAALGNLCLMDLQRGDLRAGLACYERALPRLAEVRAPALAGAALTNVGRAWDVLGEPERALAAYDGALERLRSAGNREGEARALNNLALLHQEMGEVQEALALYGEALEIFRAVGDRRWQARVLNNVGLVYHALGEPGRALPQYDQALTLWREVGDRAGEANTLSNLGAAHGRLGQPAEALAAHRQALELRRAAGDRRGESIALARLASARLAQGDLPAALADYGAAAESLREAGDLANEADAELGRGRVQMKMNEPAKALASFSRALEIARAVKHPAVEAQALGEMARAERLLGRAAEARARAAEALEVADDLRTRIGSPDLRAAFSATQQRTWDLRLELLMEAHRADPAAGHDRAAFEAAERARARTLLELLGEAGVDLRQGVDPEMLRRRTSLQRRLSAKAERALREKPRAEWSTEREEILRELDLLEAEIRRRHPGFAALTRPRPLSAADIQAQLGPDTLLLSFALGEERSWLWAATATSLDAFELPRRAEIEAAARALHEALSVFDVADRPAQSRAAAELSRRLLGPVAGRLDAQRLPRLAVVADGALGYLPFGVLPRPGSDEPLLARHELVHLPSASALAVQRELLARRAPAARQVAVVADPVFDPADGFAPLPASRQEAEAIAALAAIAAPGQALAALGADAGRELALGGGLSGYRTVHFATHGVIDAEHPALSGLALATLDERGRPREGFLHLRDIYNLRLGADLVVLSGCRTALGREVRGEGLVGLTRGFLYAGAPRVVASLWRVEDRATAELMARFYRALWVDGLPPAAALRAAQLSIRGERRWRDPWFWAGWVIQGVWP